MDNTVRYLVKLCDLKTDETVHWANVNVPVRAECPQAAACRIAKEVLEVSDGAVYLWKVKLV